MFTSWWSGTKVELKEKSTQRSFLPKTLLSGSTPFSRSHGAQNGVSLMEWFASLHERKGGYRRQEGDNRAFSNSPSTSGVGQVDVLSQSYDLAEFA
jgi:hypothetical protein